jgi:DNA-binding beta-propeller fold protein YncE
VSAALCLLFSAGCAQSQSNSPQQTGPFSHLAVSPAFHSSHVTVGIGLLTSLVAVNGQLLMSDGRSVFRLARTPAGSYTITALAKPDVAAWAPVGLAYAGGALYVANESGHDVLQLAIEGDALRLVRRYTDALLVAPEGVAVEPDGAVAVTDQSAGAVLLFGADGKVAWRQPLRAAHGLTAANGFVYASSLATNAISKISDAGTVVEVRGSTGVASGRYLWPWGLASTGDQVLVTDAHNGRITVLDRDLNVQRTVGGNGAGMDALNFPLAAVPAADGYWIADTFRSRVVRTDRRWVIQEQVAFGALVPVGRQRSLVFGTDQRPYTYQMLPGVDLAGEMGLRPAQRFVGSFDGLDHVTANGSVAHVDFDDPALEATSQTWAQKVGQLLVVGSSENRLMEVIDPQTGMYTYLVVGQDVWWHSGTVLLPGNVRRDLTDVIAPAEATFARAKQRLAQGTSRTAVFDQELNQGRKKNWSLDLSSPAGQQFLHSGMTPDDARRFFDATLGQPQQRAVELLDVKYLSGV